MNEHYLLGIGKRLRKFRRQKKLTLQILADRSGVSKSLLSRIENGRSVPSLPVLLRLIRELDLEAEAFFHDLHFAPRETYVHRRNDDYRPIQKEIASVGFNYFEILEETFGNMAIQANILEIEPHSHRDLVTTDAHEFKYVLSGQIDYQIGEEFIPLSAGDTLFYDGRLPHVPHNRTEQKATLLVLYLYELSAG
jgi:transcriptional regulator with XRE-family HTH domain